MKANKQEPVFNLVERLAKLPNIAYVDGSKFGNPDGAPVYAIVKGENSYRPVYIDKTAKQLNDAAGVSEAAAEAMFIGSCFGWHVPGADPDYQIKVMAQRAARNTKAKTAKAPA